MIEHPFPEKISKNEINDFFQVQFQGTVHIVDTPEKIKPALTCLNKEMWLGFDTETRPSFHKGKRNAVSLLQLSTSREVFLFRLNYLHLPTALKKLFENEKIIKLGVALHEDIQALQKLASFEPKGFLDFVQIAKKLGLKNSGLRSLAAIFLKVRISKGMRLSNWESRKLTPSQITYAATDAWICREMYIQLRYSGIPEEILQVSSNTPNRRRIKKSLQFHSLLCESGVET